MCLMTLCLLWQPLWGAQLEPCLSLISDSPWALPDHLSVIFHLLHIKLKGDCLQLPAISIRVLDYSCCNLFYLPCQFTISVPWSSLRASTSRLRGYKDSVCGEVILTHPDNL